jgi:hypothetical protein
MRSASRRVGKKGERAAGCVRIVVERTWIEEAGMVEVSGMGWPEVGFRLADMSRAASSGNGSKG